MKVTIELTEVEVKALKAYLQEVNGEGSKIMKKDIADEIQGIINTSIQSGSLGEYYNQFS